MIQVYYNLMPCLYENNNEIQILLKEQHNHETIFHKVSTNLSTSWIMFNFFRLLKIYEMVTT
jgi:hypothetical protein